MNISARHLNSQHTTPRTSFGSATCNFKNETGSGSEFLSDQTYKRGANAPRADEFVRAMRSIASSVTIVATGKAPDRYGMTATAVCSLTATPPQMLACLNVSSSTTAAILRNSIFSINLLGSQDSALAARFAGRHGHTGEQRFQREFWSPGDHGSPILENALVSVECAIQQSMTVDTHVLIVGTVLSIKGDNSFAPLLYGDGKFGGWQALREGREPPGEG